MHPEPCLVPTATRFPGHARGAVVVCGSHGGRYAGYLVARSGARAAIFNDAGVGKDAAGIGSLELCEAIGMAAATVGHDSARIGDPDDMLSRGIITHANPRARDAGCVEGLDCARAAELLVDAPLPTAEPPHYAEARHVAGANRHGLRIVCIDSVSLVHDEDDVGQIVLSGSHGAVVWGQRGLVIRVAAAAAFYNDAGIGVDEAGVSRLPVLDERGIAAATVAAASARIGDGRSTYEDGVLSRVNRTARRLGLGIGQRARDAVELIDAADQADTR